MKNFNKKLTLFISMVLVSQVVVPSESSQKGYLQGLMNFLKPAAVSTPWFGSHGSPEKYVQALSARVRGISFENYKKDPCVRVLSHDYQGGPSPIKRLEYKKNGEVQGWCEAYGWETLDNGGWVTINNEDKEITKALLYESMRILKKDYDLGNVTFFCSSKEIVFYENMGFSCTADVGSHGLPRGVCRARIA